MDRGLIDQYRELHRNPVAFKGGELLNHVEDIGRVIRETGSRFVLDYGCGKALYQKSLKLDRVWGVDLTLYDPAWPEFEARPVGRFDGVICTAVLEHVESPEEVIADVLNYARKFVFLMISCKPATHCLPDGRNEHVSLHPPSWWRERIKAGCRLELRFDVPG